MVLTNTSERNVIIAGVLLTISLLVFSSLAFHILAVRFFNIYEMTAGFVLLSRFLYWGVLMFIGIYSFKIEKQDLVIWPNQKHNFITHFLSAIVIFFIIIILNAIVSQVIFSIIGHKEKSLQVIKLAEIFKAHKFILIFSAFTAGVTEELLFRAYLLPRLEILFKNSYLAVFVSSLVFAGIHYGYHTIVNITGPFIIGVIFSLYYLKYRNIYFLIIFHFLWDIFAFILAIKMYSH
ncbi:MAG TPA: type II CAAX endopeptidase family protein [Puia sp.]|nr:type II CAAX endopeptidase family protein [Puia sp.]